MARRSDEAVWRALAEPTRRRILDLLRGQPRQTGELCAAFAVSRYAVMKHLTVLEAAGLVFHRRDGRTRWNYLSAVPIQRIYERWVRGYERFWAAELVALQRSVETEERTMAAGESKGREPRSGAGWFEVQQEVLIAAPRERVFAALTHDIDRWWRFRIGRGASRLVLEPQLGGRFCEEFERGGGALWGTVTYIDPPVQLRLSGPLGMVERPVTSIYSYTLEERETGTLLKLAHVCVGDLDPSWVESYSGGWVQLLKTDLKRFVEEGKPFEPAAKK